MRIGLGHDVHRLVAGRTLMLGGVAIAYDLGPDGHSDGDVLLHALTDAILGAAGLGDIGQWFPDTDPEWKNADSALFVHKAILLIRERGWKIGNVDCTIFAERPKLKQDKPRIRAGRGDFGSLGGRGQRQSENRRKSRPHRSRRSHRRRCDRLAASRNHPIALTSLTRSC